MGFLHPWAIAVGAAAVALPFLIHWLTRPRPSRLPLSTIRFVREVVEQRRARHRLRDYLVLLLRAAAVALLAWAFARPLLGQKPLVAVGEDGDAVRIVILDQSQSMAAVVGGTSSFERGRSAAAEYLSHQPGLRGNLILTGARPRTTFEQVSSHFSAMRDQLGSAAPRPERLNLQASLSRAAELLSQAPPEARRELVIISDFQRSGWVSADFSGLPQDTLIQLESVAAERTSANVGILGVGAHGRLEQGREVRIDVEVGNYSATPREVQVELLIGEQSHRLSGLLPPGVATTLSGEVTLRQRGWQAGQARLLGISDALSEDNVRPFVLDVRPAPTYALVTRQSAQPRPVSSHFLERALAPGSSRDGSSARERVVRISSAQLDRESLSGVELIVLDHPGRLEVEQVNLLAGLLRRGRGVLYVASEPVDAVNLKLLEEAAGRELRLPVEFMPPEAGQPRRGLFLVEWRSQDAPWSIFGEDLASVVTPLRFAGGLSTRRTEGGLIDDVLALYSDRSACLVVTQCGLGTLAVLNADLGESSLPASPGFVPLIGELTGRLLSLRGGEDAAASGEPVALYLPAEAGAAEGLSIHVSRVGEGRAGLETAADGAVTDLHGALSEEGGFVMWRWAAAGPPGIYEVRREGGTVFAVATAVPGSESNLETIDPEVLTGRLAGGRRVHYQPAGDAEQQKDDAWAWILAICAACMLSELAVLKVFRT
jgi:hypothetical protein